MCFINQLNTSNCCVCEIWYLFMHAQAYESSIMAIADLLCTFFRLTSDVIYIRLVISIPGILSYQIFSRSISFTSTSFLWSRWPLAVFDRSVFQSNRPSIILQALLTISSSVVVKHLQVSTPAAFTQFHCLIFKYLFTRKRSRLISSANCS